MFNNIGGKIKGFAQIVCWLGIIGSIITGFVFIGIGSDSRNGGGIVFLGILIAIVGSIASWIGSFLTYGFGQLVENSDKLVKQDNTTTGSHSYGNNSTQGDCKERVGYIYVGETNISAIIVGVFNSREIKNASGATQHFQIKREARILKRLDHFGQAFLVGRLGIAPTNIYITLCRGGCPHPPVKTMWLSNQSTHTPHWQTHHTQSPVRRL